MDRKKLACEVSGRATFKIDVDGVYVFNGAASANWTVGSGIGAGNQAASAVGHIVVVNKGTAILTLSTADTNFAFGAASPTLVVPVGAAVVLDLDGTNYAVTSTATPFSTRGESTFAGTGAQVAFVIPHGLGQVPKSCNVTPASAAAAALLWVSKDATNITVTYLVAPANAASIILEWSALA